MGPRVSGERISATIGPKSHMSSAEIGFRLGDILERIGRLVGGWGLGRILRRRALSLIRGLLTWPGLVLLRLVLLRGGRIGGILSAR